MSTKGQIEQLTAQPLSSRPDRIDQLVVLFAIAAIIVFRWTEAEISRGVNVAEGQTGCYVETGRGYRPMLLNSVDQKSDSVAITFAPAPNDGYCVIRIRAAK